MRSRSFSSVLKNKNFFRLWMGQVISSIGDRFYQFALLAIIVGLNPTSGIGKEGARITFTGMLPALFLTPLWGWLVDHFHRKKILVFTDIARALAALSILWVWFSLENMFLVYGVVLFMGAMQSLFIPARQSVLPQVVSSEHLVTANSLIATIGIIASLLGVVASSFISSLFGAHICFTLTFLGFLISAYYIQRIDCDLTSQNAKPAGGWRENIKKTMAGATYVWRCGEYFHLVLLGAIFSFASGFFLVSGLEMATIYMDLGFIEKGVDIFKIILTPFSLNAPVFEIKVLALGVLFLALALGLGAGVLFCGKSKRWSHSKILPYAVVIFTGLLFCLFSQINNFLYGLVIMVFLGFCSSSFLIPIDSRLQKQVPSELQGRVFAFRNLLNNVTFLLALAAHLSGHLLKNYGAENCILLLGVGTFLGGGYFSFTQRKVLREFWC